MAASREEVYERVKEVLSEQLGLALHQLGGKRFECIGNLCMQLLSGAAQQAAVSGVLHQRVLEGVYCVRRAAALKHQLGGDKAGKSSSQLVCGKPGDGMQQFIRELTPDRGANLRDVPY